MAGYEVAIVCAWRESENFIHYVSNKFCPIFTFQDKIHIELPNDTKYALINIQGQVVMNGFSENPGIIELMLSNIDPGMYYIIFECNTQRSTIPIVKR